MSFHHGLCHQVKYQSKEPHTSSSSSEFSRFSRPLWRFFQQKQNPDLPEKIHRFSKSYTWISQVCKICVSFSPKKIYQKGRKFTKLEDPGILTYWIVHCPWKASTLPLLHPFIVDFRRRCLVPSRWGMKTSWVFFLDFSVGKLMGFHMGVS